MAALAILPVLTHTHFVVLRLMLLLTVCPLLLVSPMKAVTLSMTMTSMILLLNNTLMMPIPALIASVTITNTVLINVLTTVTTTMMTTMIPMLEMCLITSPLGLLALPLSHLLVCPIHTSLALAPTLFSPSTTMVTLALVI